MSRALPTLLAIGLFGVLTLASHARAQEQDEAGASSDTAETADDEGQAESEPEQNAVRPSPFDFALGFMGFSRSFDYRDNLSGLRSYGLDLGPSLAVKLHWYPGAHFESGVAAQIGLDLRGQAAFALDSAFGSRKFSTSANAFGIGARARLPLGEHELAAVIGYGHQTFAIDDATIKTGKVDPGVPSAAYSFARLGTELRLLFGDFAVGAALAYLPTFATGEVGRMFPHASAAGVEGELSLSHALSSAFDLSLTVGLQRFAYSMNPKLSEVSAGRPIAGGALDQYLWGAFAARFVLDR